MSHSPKTPPQPKPQISSDPLVIAKPLVRVMAVLYDGMLILAMLFLVMTVLVVIGTLLFGEVGSGANEARPLPSWYQYGVLTPMFVLTLAGFYGVFWGKSGQTLGMQTWRLKTVDSHGQLLGWSQSCRRVFSACLLPLLCATIGGVLYGKQFAIGISAFLGFLCNYIFCIFNNKGLAFHDILSNTMTLKVPKFNHEGLFASFKKSNHQ